MASSPVPTPHPSGPLSGYRVLDFSDEKGQLCARLFGELGADVIKVEPPRNGDPSRARGPFFRGEEGPETSLWWWAMNAGKRSITCQLQLSAGRELMHRLAAQADIVIETCMPPSSADVGLDYATLSGVNPGLVVVSITNFGQTGPYKSWQATDMVGAAMGGLMSVTGDPERGPVRTLAPQALTQVNIQAAVGAMTALYARGVNGGVGQLVDASMQEAVVNSLDHRSATWDISGQVCRKCWKWRMGKMIFCFIRIFPIFFLRLHVVIHMQSTENPGLMPMGITASAFWKERSPGNIRRALSGCVQGKSTGRKR